MEGNKNSRASRHALAKNLAAGIAIAALTVAVLVFTPVRTLLPGYLTPQSREQLVTFALRMDSLGDAVAKQDMYVTNLQDILKGRVHVDSIVSIDSLTALRTADLMEQTEREREFVRQYEENEKYNLYTQASLVNSVSGLNLVCPVLGTVDDTFDPDNYRYDVEVAALPGTPVVAVTEGTVLLSNYTANEGYTIVIQHNGDLISACSHCGMLLKNKGDKVHSGEAVASVGNGGDANVATAIHFEMWHKGVALHPTAYIAF